MEFKYKYLLFGIGFGLLFPVSATLIESWLQNQSLAIDALVQAQSSQPLLIMIDTAPLFLGLFAFIAGRHFDTVNKVNKERESLLKILETQNEALEEKIALRTELLEINMKKAQAASNAKSHFVASISHELRTPLTAINGALQLVRGGVTGPLPDKAQELLTLAQNNSDRLMGLIQELLDLNALENNSLNLNCNVQPLVPLLKQAIKDSKSYAEACNIQLKLELPSYPYEVNVDKNRVIQILSNIISNAIKFSSDNTTVVVSISDQEGQVCIAIKDQGRGIEADRKDKIFESFSEFNHGNTRHTGSLGLGLKLAKELTEKMYGSIDFDSTFGKGSTFRIWLPMVDKHRQVINRF